MVGARSFLAASRLMKNQTRGKALANWARPSIDEMGVPTESWKQVYIHIHILTYSLFSVLYYDEQTKHWTMIYVITFLTPDA